MLYPPPSGWLSLFQPCLELRLLALCMLTIMVTGMSCTCPEWISDPSIPWFPDLQSKYLQDACCLPLLLSFFLPFFFIFDGGGDKDRSSKVYVWTSSWKMTRKLEPWWLRKVDVVGVRGTHLYPHGQDRKMWTILIMEATCNMFSLL